MSWIGRTDNVKVAILPKAIDLFNITPSKFQRHSPESLKNQSQSSFGSTKGSE
jgi:hypothetical protein